MIPVKHARSMMPRYLRGYSFILGKIYYLRWNENLPMKCKFIQVTRFGYNFLNEETNQCVLQRHLYVPKKLREILDTDEKFLYIIDDLNFVPPELVEAEIEYYHKKRLGRKSYRGMYTYEKDLQD